MIVTVEVQRFDDGLGIALPEDLAARLGFQEGEKLHVVPSSGGILLTSDADVARAMDMYAIISKKYRNAMRELADS